jgi:protoheme IX farnesyltransferase
MTNTKNNITWKNYLELCKPRVVALLVFTANVGMLLAVPGMPPIALFLYATLGIGLASASAAAINHFIDQKADAQMARTQNRPLPQGDLNSKNVLFFAAILGITAMLILVFLVNTLTAVLTFVSLIGYAVIYTVYLKRMTPRHALLVILMAI